MANGTFTHNSKHTKTLKTPLVKTHRKVLKTSNLAYTMLLVQGQISHKYGFFCIHNFLLAVLGSQGIVV